VLNHEIELCFKCSRSIRHIIFPDIFLVLFGSQEKEYIKEITQENQLEMMMMLSCIIMSWRKRSGLVVLHPFHHLIIISYSFPQT